MKNRFITMVLITGALHSGILAQIPNGGFENWTNMGSYEVPASWGTTNHLTSAQALYTASKAAPGNPGSFYLKLTSKMNGSAVMNGVAVSGKLDTISLQPVSGFAFSQRPAVFGGKWQHMIYGNSQGGISILLTAWNTSQNSRDTIAHAEQTLSGMAMSWANFSMNLTYLDSLRNPDSCMIVLKASGSAPTANDYLWVDGLNFTGTVAVYTPPIDPNPVGISNFKAGSDRISIYPNPVHDQFSIEFFSGRNQSISISVLDLTGKVVMEFASVAAITGNNSIPVKTRSLPQGLYFVQIKKDELIVTKKIVVQ